MKIAFVIACLFVSLCLGAPPSAPPLPTVAVLTLSSAAGVSPGEVELLTDRLRIELFNTGRFSVQERDQMQAILSEQGFQQSGACSDEGCMVEIGQILGVRQIVTGSIGKLGSLYMINIRLIDVASAKIARVVSRDVKGAIEEVVLHLPPIAAQLAGLSVVAPPAPAPLPPPPSAPQMVQSAPAAPLVATTKTLYLQSLEFNSANCPISATPEEFRSLNEEINGELLEALNEVFDEAVVLVSGQQLAALPPATQLPIMRFSLRSYVTQPDARNQFRGTAEVLIELFMAPGAPQPANSVQVQRSGDRHWGQITPFSNAFEEIAEYIEEDLEGLNWIRELKRQIR